MTKAGQHCLMKARNGALFVHVVSDTINSITTKGSWNHTLLNIKHFNHHVTLDVVLKWSHQMQMSWTLLNSIQFMLAQQWIEETWVYLFQVPMTLWSANALTCLTSFSGNAKEYQTEKWKWWKWLIVDTSNAMQWATQSIGSTVNAWIWLDSNLNRFCASTSSCSWNMEGFDTVLQFQQSIQSFQQIFGCHIWQI